ncbi:Purine nucleoside phosphorylase DeoD-type [Listeria monocytogenes N53-1]|nr:Purine nucleoside phosphorylase DeoD-type [Listeria monocytogenes N53-1]
MQLKTKAITDASITIQTEAGLSGKPQLVNETNLITSYKGTSFGEMDAAENGQAAYGVQAGNYAYAPLFQTDNTSEFTLMDVLKALFDIKTTTNQYAFITGVNPFVDFDLLKKTADTFYEKGIPFIVSAGPVFYNQDFQAAKNYAEILRYVQAKNGTITGIVRRENLKALCKNRYISSRKMTGTLIKYMA